MPQTKRHHRWGRTAALIVAVFSCLLAVIIFTNRQSIADQLAFWRYSAPQEIATLADRSGMSSRGRFLFYASQPALETATDFNGNCKKTEQATAILGCYVNNRIYIYNVDNPQLDGIREVTAAHEMLHVAYDRMSSGEKQRINALLEDEYAKLRTDAEFADRMSYYARAEPGERDNELHSIIGTEVADIDPELEVHYKAYFTNRASVVSLHKKYAQVFADLSSKSDELTNQLNTLIDQINLDTKKYNTDASQLNSDISSFNARASSGDFSSQSDFNVERAALEARVNQLESNRMAINQKVDQYNSIRDELLSLASQSDALNRSLNSTLAPAPSV
ncbi:MAG TPA: hypothetical protein VJ841_01405 [Candidatus Saccharimonadales bacterium]|nr:hypothetical protein [Candidatus Saccharimonadales bacterium]